ncbi:aminodeoxychorismate/anthranilate synthase component II [Lysobacter sp. N42]|nr:aminodeoxychorismate/anthranilate synthase component II [Aliidiomarina sp. B3213]TCZ93410.1 aminodeoxychorismate/anthranilate synthase component II [Lysobacter sp. N42]
MLDNQDSFTYNLVDDLASLGYHLEVYRNTTPINTLEAKLTELEGLGPVLVVMSPGPGHPREAGVLIELIGLCENRFPMLGICLGFQALVEYFGGQVARCYETVHGKTSHIDTEAHNIFSNLAAPLPVARYHSLMAHRVSEQLNVIASFQDIPMAIEHSHLPVMGFQFHPESILSQQGEQLLAQTVNYLMNKSSTTEVAQ